MQVSHIPNPQNGFPKEKRMGEKRFSRLTSKRNPEFTKYLPLIRLNPQLLPCAIKEKTARSHWKPTPVQVESALSTFNKLHSIECVVFTVEVIINSCLFPTPRHDPYLCSGMQESLEKEKFGVLNLFP
jgi:hypothetical protein